MGSAPVRRSAEARLDSSLRRGAPVGPGASGVYRVRRAHASEAPDLPRARVTPSRTLTLLVTVPVDLADLAGNVEFIESRPLTSVTLTFTGAPSGFVGLYDRDTGDTLPAATFSTTDLTTQTVTDPTILAALSVALSTADSGQPAWSHLYISVQPGPGSTGTVTITATV